MKFSGLVGLLTLVAFFWSKSADSQVFFEDFSGEGNGATSGTAVGGTWSTTAPTGGAASFSRFFAGPPYGGIIAVNQTGTEGVWRSNNINISALGEVALEVLMGGNDADNADYVRAYYSINGGAEVLFGEVRGDDGLVLFAASSAVVSGNTLQIVIRGRDNSGGAGLMGFDDILVTDISVLYSRQSSAWNNTATWSTAGFGGGSCSCTPSDDTRVIIGNNRTVTFTASGTSAGVEIQNTGTLQWTANNLTLTLARGGPLNVLNGGVLTRVATTGSTITFGNYTYSNTIAGTVNIGRIAFNGGNSVINNSGTITLATSPGLTITAGNGFLLNNSGTVNLSVMDLNTFNLTVNNSGTINQTGSFTDVDAGSTFNNLAGGTWNFGGTAVANVRLFADNNSNTFNYNAAGAQPIITPQDAYSNLTLSGSGAKSAAANFSVRGNWTRSGTATFTPGAFRVSLTGTIAQTINGPAGGEAFSNLTINNTFATSPQVTLNNRVSVSTNLTMTDGNINLNGNIFTITPNTPAALTHNMTAGAGWMYGGNLTRSYPTTAIAVGNVAGFYPLGSSAHFRPFFISKNNIANSNGTVTIGHTDATSGTNITFGDNGPVTIQRRHDSFWSVTKTGVTAGTFAISAGGAGYLIGNIAHTRLTRASDATGIGTAGASTGTVADVRVHRTGLTAAQLVNSFYLASTNAASTALPIELVYYHAQVEGDEVVSRWKTAQEKNNHFFTIQRTTDFETFYEVGSIDGQGDSREEHTYSFSDDSPIPGKSYYRLKQTDFDGKFTFSSPVMVNYEGPTSPVLKAYPNPSGGNELTIEIKGLNDSSTPVHIYNSQGQLVLTIVAREKVPGIIKEEILFPQSLPPGMYIVKTGRLLQLNKKIYVSK